MSTFQELESKWKENGLNDMLLAKFQILLTDDSEEGVKSCVELLRSFGDEGLCVVLKQEENGQIVLREDLGIVHRLVWITEIVSIITQEGSVWKSLYESDAFGYIEVQDLANVEWRNLSEVQQKKVVSFSMSCVEVPAGSFMMGALPSDENAYEDEKPQHEVTLTKGMMVSKYACTQGLYEFVMGENPWVLENPSFFKGSMKPVENVSWCDAVLFCNRLSEMEGLEPVYIFPEPFENDDDWDDWSKKVKWNHNANGYRLPTEAEWEYCARGGESHLYSGSNNMDEVGWYDGNCNNETDPVGQKKSNGFGLYDMSGNVWEWVWDSSLRDYDSFTTDPIYVDMSAPDRVSRGGAWDYSGGGTRVSFRISLYASFHDFNGGFRFIKTLR